MLYKENMNKLIGLILFLSSCIPIEQEARELWQDRYHAAKCPIPTVIVKVSSTCEDGWLEELHGQLRCVHGSYNPAKNLIVITGGSFYRRYLKHELKHAALLCETGDGDAFHNLPVWDQLEREGDR